MQNNKDSTDRIAINYLGNRITYRALFDNIHATAKGFVTLGVKERDIVTIALPSVPEALYAVYALNMIGAVANMIHPLAGKSELISYLREVNSEVCVIFDKTYEIICDSLESTNIRRAIVVTIGDSMPLTMRALYNLRSKKLDLPAHSRFITWKGFIKAGSGENIPHVRKNHNETAIISHTGGTTGEPKGVMCSDRNINALIWQIIKSVSLIRDGRFLAVLPPFVNYSLVQNMIEGLVLGFEVQLIPKHQFPSFWTHISSSKSPLFGQE